MGVAKDMMIEADIQQLSIDADREDLAFGMVVDESEDLEAAMYTALMKAIDEQLMMTV